MDLQLAQALQRFLISPAAPRYPKIALMHVGLIRHIHCSFSVEEYVKPVYIQQLRAQ